MSNFHFDLSLKLPQGEVHMTFQERCKNSQGRCKTISGEALTSPYLPSKSGYGKRIYNAQNYANVKIWIAQN
jgi:hypothetical protein